MSTALGAYEVDNGKYPNTAQGLAALLVKPLGAARSPRAGRALYLSNLTEIPRDPVGQRPVHLPRREARERLRPLLVGPGRAGGDRRRHRHRRPNEKCRPRTTSLRRAPRLAFACAGVGFGVAPSLLPTLRVGERRRLHPRQAHPRDGRGLHARRWWSPGSRTSSPASRSASRRSSLMAWARKARADAAVTGTRQRLYLDPAKRKYWIEYEPRPIKEPGKFVALPGAWGARSRLRRSGRSSSRSKAGDAPADGPLRRVPARTGPRATRPSSCRTTRRPPTLRVEGATSKIYIEPQAEQPVKTRQGFTLIEVLVALVVAVAAMTLLSQGFMTGRGPRRRRSTPRGPPPRASACLTDFETGAAVGRRNPERRRSRTSRTSRTRRSRRPERSRASNKLTVTVKWQERDQDREYVLVRLLQDRRRRRRRRRPATPKHDAQEMETPGDSRSWS